MTSICRTSPLIHVPPTADGPSGRVKSHDVPSSRFSEGNASSPITPSGKGRNVAAEGRCAAIVAGSDVPTGMSVRSRTGLSTGELFRLHAEIPAHRVGQGQFEEVVHSFVELS